MIIKQWQQVKASCSFKKMGKILQRGLRRISTWTTQKKVDTFEVNFFKMCSILLKRKILFFVILSLIILTWVLYYATINLQESNEITLPMIKAELNLRGFDTPPTTEQSSTITSITEQTLKSRFYHHSTVYRTLEKPPLSSILYECCTRLNSTLRTNVYFLKTHKTGSSTVQNIILRFAMKNSLDVMNIIYGTYYLPLSDASIYQHVKTVNNKYHILAHHIRYTSELSRYQYPNTAVVTIMRHPADLFQSLYDYFRMNESTGMTFQQFLNASIKPVFFYSPTSWFAYRGYNQMGYDLGFNLETNVNNQTAIDEFIEKIDREFDLVMITEHMEESLVLLANLMGWPLEYVAHLKINARPRNVDNYKLTTRDKYILMELNHVDTQLYHHFLRKFLKCVRQYGQEKLKREVVRLRMLNERFKERCVAKEHVGGLMDGYLKAIEYVPKNISDSECVYATSLEIPLEFTVLNEQYKRLQQEYSKPSRNGTTTEGTDEVTDKSVMD